LLSLSVKDKLEYAYQPIHKLNLCGTDVQYWVLSYGILAGFEL